MELKMSVSIDKRELWVVRGPRQSMGADLIDINMIL